MASHVAAPLLVRPLDDHIQQSRFNSELHDSTTLDWLFDPGAFATATVIQRRYGWKAGVAAHVVAVWIGASLLNASGAP